MGLRAQVCRLCKAQRLTGWWSQTGVVSGTVFQHLAVRYLEEALFSNWHMALGGQVWPWSSAWQSWVGTDGTQGSLGQPCSRPVFLSDLSLPACGAQLLHVYEQGGEVAQVTSLGAAQGAQHFWWEPASQALTGLGPGTVASQSPEGEPFPN